MQFKEDHSGELLLFVKKLKGHRLTPRPRRRTPRQRQVIFVKAQQEERRIPEPPGKKTMNLNDFVVLPNNKAKSFKLNVRNVQELHAETATLAQESKAMEERLQLLRECMSREKEERGWSGGYRWRSVQAASVTNGSTGGGNKRNKENTLHKLSAGKVKITVLRDEPVAASRVPRLALPPSVDVLTSRKPRLRGKICGQCEVKTAGLVCAECSEDYCVGCFARFHQKGALKLHRMIPIQTDMHTHVSTLDVVNRFQQQAKSSSSSNPDVHSDPCRGPKKGPNPKCIHDQNIDTNSSHISMSSTVHSDCRPAPTVHVVRGGEWSHGEVGGIIGPKVSRPHTEHSQVLVVQHSTEEEDGGVAGSLLGGEYDEEQSARCFQEALWEWRGGSIRTEGGQRTDTAGDGVWRPAEARPVSVSVVGTQADLCSGAGGRLPVRVEFSENNLTYMDRLLLKKHRRTPVEGYRPSSALASALGSAIHTEASALGSAMHTEASALGSAMHTEASALGSAMHTEASALGSAMHTEDKKANNSLTAEEEEDFCQYYSSLFAGPASRGRAEPERHTPAAPCLSIQVLDERVGDFDGAFAAEQTAEDNVTFSPIQHVSNKRNEKNLLPGSTNDRSPKLSPPVPCPADPSQRSSEPLKSPGYTKVQLQSQRSMKSSSSKAKPSPRPAGEPLRTSKTSTQTPTSRSLKPEGSTTDPPESKHDRRSATPLLPSQAETPHPPSASPPSFTPRFSALSPARGRTLQSKGSGTYAPSDLSVTLRSTFPLSPPSSARPEAPPKVLQSPPSPKASESVPLSRRSQSPHSHGQSPSSPEHAQSQLSMESLKQSQCSVRDPESTPSSRERLKPPFPPTLSPALLNAPRTKRCTSSPPPSSLRESTRCPVSLQVSAKSILEPSLRPPATRPVSSGPPQTSSAAPRRPPAGAPSRCVSAPPAQNIVCVSRMCQRSGYESTALHQEIPSLGSPPPHRTTTTHSPESSMNMEDGLFIHTSMTADGETSSESLHLCGSEEDTSDEEINIGDDDLEDRRNVPIATSGHSVPVDPRMALDEVEVGLLSEPSMAVSVLAPKAAPRYCGQDGFLTQGSVQSTHSSPTHTAARGSVIPTTTVPRTSTPAPSRPGSTDPLPPRSSPLLHPLTPSSSSLPSLCSSGRGLRVASSAMASRPLSRAAQEILDICGVDDVARGGPDLDAEADWHTLDCLERELRSIASDSHVQTAGYTAMEDGGTTGQHPSPALTWGGMSEEQKEEEEEVLRDRQSVLSLP